MQRPNLIYIHSHDTGRYIQPYGYPVQTPNLQKFAEQGVLFRQAYCASPTCSPSRAALLTGQYAHQNGMLGLAHRGFRLRNYSQHILHTLRGAGYVSALAGMQHIANTFPEPWKAIGYDRYLGGTGAGDAQTGSIDLPFLQSALEFLERPPSQPFFLSIGFEETHRPYPPLPQEGISSYTLPPVLLPDTPETREDMARFKVSAQNLDTKMGAVFDTLDRTGLRENTFVLCTTDHGLAFPRMKCNLTGHGTGVMLMLRGPGGFSGGKVFDSLVSQIDIFPTLCEFLEIPPPPWLEGVSLMPLLQGRAQEVRQEVFAEINYHAAYEPVRSVRTRRWSYIRRYDLAGHPIFANTDDSPSKRLLLGAGWGETPPDAEALYDLVFDPNETDNLLQNSSLENHPGAAGALYDLRGRLQRWMEATQDPLLYGPIPAPPGAVIDGPETLSPS